MKIVFDHSTGVYNLEHNSPLLEVRGIEEPGDVADELLATGWLPELTRPGHWYQARSARLKAGVYTPSKRRRNQFRKLSISLQPLAALDVAEVDALVMRYSAGKADSILESYAALKSSDFGAMAVAFFCLGKLAGISIYRQVSCKSILCCFVAYDPDYARLSLGINSCYVELEIAACLGCEYAYIFECYPNQFAYKELLPGYEWWNGQSWVQESGKTSKRSLEVSVEGCAKSATRRPFNWFHPALQLGAAQSGGFGVYTTERIRQRETIIVLGGHIVSCDALEHLAPHLAERGVQISARFCIGPTSDDELELPDYINHSCCPNAGFDGQLFLVALRDIEAGEEITLDYAMCLAGPQPYALKCCCGTASCRERVTHEDWKLPELQARYRGHFQPHVQECISAFGVLIDPESFDQELADRPSRP